MKSIIRSLTTLGLISTTVVGSWLLQGVKVLALPTEVIVEQLKFVPVYTLSDSKGGPLVASTDDNIKFTRVFISPKDANTFFKGSRKTKC